MSAQSSRAATKPGIRKIRGRGGRDVSGLRQSQVQLFEPKGRKATHYET